MPPADAAPDSAKLARGREVDRWHAEYPTSFGAVPSLPVATLPEGCPYPLFEDREP